MAKKTFISFDFDHDEDLRNLLVGQAKHPDSPFEIVDRSLKEALTGDWKLKVKGRIERSDLVIVLCGEHTHTATGVDVELAFAIGLGKPYFLLKGRNGRACTRPKNAPLTDKMYSWTWDILNQLIGGAR